MKVTTLPYYPPRKSERTWTPIVGSISNIGRKQVSLRSSGRDAKKKIA
jgi:hypothetical protein